MLKLKSLLSFVVKYSVCVFVVDVSNALQQQQLILNLNQSYSQLLRWHQELMERVHQLESQQQQPPPRVPHRSPPQPPAWAQYSSESFSRDQQVSIVIECGFRS
jgi:hypothetical protein